MSKEVILNDNYIVLLYNYHKQDQQDQIKYDSVASFDLDNTIIKTKSSNKFPVDYNDWSLKENVVEKLSKINNKQLIIIFTNQNSKNFDKTLFIGKMDNIISELSLKLQKVLQIQVFISITKSIYRKPGPGLFRLMINMNNINLDDNFYTNSFYVGDAAGRRGDFSDTDYKFAINNNIKFYTQDTYFNNKKEMLPRPLYPLHLVLDKPDVNINDLSDVNDQEVIILVGAPASGKTLFANNFIKSNPRYVIVSNDLHKTKTKKLFDTYISEGLSVIVDNTNGTVKNRAIYKINKINTRVIYFERSKEVSIHLNNYRNITNPAKTVPIVAIHTYYKHFEKPTLSEGFSSIITINYINKHSIDIIDNIEYKDLINMYLS